MALVSYTKTVWVNDSAPARDATNLNNQETGIYDVTEVAKTNESTLSTLATTYQPIDSATAKYDETTTWQMAFKESLYTETYAATVAFDMDDSNHFAVTLTGNITLGNPTNTADDEIQQGLIILTQDATGGRTLTLDTSWVLVGTDSTDTAADKVNIYKYTVIDSTTVLYEFVKAI